jgi:serine/threonine-protein kinase
MNRQSSTANAESMIGKYRLIGVLAEGGMARLYLAEQTGPQGFKKVVALKRILPHLVGHPEFAEMFLNEAIVAARLDHPHIVTTYELGEVNGQYFISMEYLPGEDLAAILHRVRATSPMPVEIATSIAQQCADALSYAHELIASDGAPVCIVHRDVNPSNVIVTYHGEAKLLDFGIAKVRNSRADMRSVGFKGKLSYASPEQIAGESLDGRSDIFCLGIVLWECLTGQRLFHGPSEAARLDAIRNRPIVAPSSIRPGIPRRLDQIVEKALMRDREQRFHNAREMAEALTSVMSGNANIASRAIGSWLEQLFGPERASVKRSTAQGHDLERNLGILHRMVAEQKDAFVPSRSDGLVAPELRIAWSTDLGGGQAIQSRSASELLRVLPTLQAPSVPDETISDHVSQVRPLSSESDPHASRPSSTRAIAVGLAALVVISLFAFFFLGRSPNTMDSARALTGTLELKSDPPGAQILINGEPTGLRTPATLSDLPVQTPVEVRAELRGYTPWSKTFRLESPGAAEHHELKMEPAVGIVRLAGLSDRSASVYVDGALVSTNDPIELSIGSHTFRVEASQKLIMQRTIDIVAGEQVIDLTK